MKTNQELTDWFSPAASRPEKEMWFQNFKLAAQFGHKGNRRKLRIADAAGQVIEREASSRALNASRSRLNGRSRSRSQPAPRHEYCGLATAMEVYSLKSNWPHSPAWSASSAVSPSRVPRNFGFRIGWLGVGLAFVLLALDATATTYYVTQAGSGLKTGTSLSNAWSVANFNASSAPVGGDTVICSGTITSSINPNTSGSGNVTRLTVDCSGATCASFAIANRSYLTIIGGSMSANAGFVFSGTGSHDITIQGWQQNNDINTGVSWFVDLYSGKCYNLTVSGCLVTNVATFIAGDTTANHDILIRNNAMVTSQNLTVQTDLIKFGDAYNVTIEGNYLLQRAPGNTVERHNDAIQCFQSGATPNAQPFNWVIRYNRIEINVQSGSGDTSQLMTEIMASPGGAPGIKIYGNVFAGFSAAGASNNGIDNDSNASGMLAYFFNNTVIRKNGPDNTIRFLAPGTLYARNNIGQANSGIIGTFLSWTMSNGGWDYNWFYNFGASGTYTGPHGGTSNPQFVDYNNNNFELSATSPCRGIGDSTIGSEYNQGIAPGSTWPNPQIIPRTTWDIGAYVYSGAVSTNPVIAISPASLNFGTVQTNTTLDLIVSVQNSGGGTLGGTATATAPFSIVAGAAYTLAAGQSQNVTIRYTPNVAGTNTQSVTFAGGGGATCQLTGIAVGALPPGIAVTPATQNFGAITAGATVDQTFVVQNTGGGILAGAAAVAAPFSIVSGGTYSLTGGQTQAVIVRFSPTVVGNSSQSVTFTGGAGAAVAVSGTAVAVVPSGGLNFLAGDATLTAPFVLTNGYFSQTVDSVVTNGGQAVFTFAITNSGTYAVQMLINAPSLAANSIYWNFDGQPQDPAMIWDMPVTTGFQLGYAGWRGNGTVDVNQFIPAKVALTQGTHQLVIIGREAGVQIQSLTIVRLPSPPSNIHSVAQK